MLAWLHITLFWGGHAWTACFPLRRCVHAWTNTFPLLGAGSGLQEGVVRSAILRGGEGLARLLYERPPGTAEAPMHYPGHQGAQALP